MKMKNEFSEHVLYISFVEHVIKLILSNYVLLVLINTIYVALE